AGSGPRGPRAALPVVRPAGLPAGPGEPEQPPPGGAGAHRRRRALPCEDGEQPAGGVDEDARPAGLVVVPAGLVEPVAAERGQGGTGPGGQAGVRVDRAAGRAPALVRLGAADDEGGPVARQRPAAVRRVAAVSAAS
ncbi:hypothetical protein ACFXA3_30760, partial [Streptomyces sp. NPDC059456]